MKVEIDILFLAGALIKILVAIFILLGGFTFVAGVIGAMRSSFSSQTQEASQWHCDLERQYELGRK